MPIEQAWLLKGFILAHGAPAEVIHAAEAVIEEMSRNARPSPIVAETEPAFSPPVVPPFDQPEEIPKASPEKKRREWSTEAREAAAERMRARIAAGKMRKNGTAPPQTATEIREGNVEAPLAAGA